MPHASTTEKKTITPGLSLAETGQERRPYLWTEIRAFSFPDLWWLIPYNICTIQGAKGEAEGEHPADPTPKPHRARSTPTPQREPTEIRAKTRAGGPADLEPPPARRGSEPLWSPATACAGCKIHEIPPAPPNSSKLPSLMTLKSDGKGNGQHHLPQRRSKLGRTGNAG